MTTGWRGAWWGVCLLALGACDAVPEDIAVLRSSATGVARESRLELKRSNTGTGLSRATPLARWRMPQVLQEISGLALTSDGRLLAHGDEFAQVFEVDYRHGILVKQFSLGKGAVRGDFEGIAAANGEVILLTSKGKLYSFKEGADGAQVDFRVTDTGLEKECEFEGLAFDPTLDALLLSCKTVHNKAFKDALVIFRWNLSGDSSAKLSRITIPRAQVIGSNGWKDLHPSDITVDPLTGNYVLVASAEEALVVLTPSGALVSAHPLPPGHHQAEGIAITKDSMLIVGDEGGKAPAIITLYQWP